MRKSQQPSRSNRHKKNAKYRKKTLNDAIKLNKKREKLFNKLSK